MTKDKQVKLRIKHLWSVLCVTSSVDRDSNNITLSNLIEEINLSQQELDRLKPEAGNDKGEVVFNTTLQLVSLWRKLADNEEVKTKVKVELVDPKGKVLNKIEFELVIPPEKSRMRQRINITGITISVGGEYTFRILTKEESMEEFVKMYDLPLVVNVK